MGSIVHITSQFNPERTYLHPEAVFNLIERGQAVPLGDRGEQRWTVPHAITIVENDDDDDYRRSPPCPSTRAQRGSSAGGWDGSPMPPVPVG